jgi:hypothetical protein
MKKIKKVSTIMIYTLYLLLPFIAYSTGGFLFELKRDLIAYGWSEEEITPFMYAAEHMNWEAIENEYADVVAYSLQYCKNCGKKITSEEKAVLAYYLAIATSEMGAVGYEDDIIVRVAVNTSREIMGDLSRYRRKEGKGNLGEIIRGKIREQVCNEGTHAQQAKFMERIRNRIEAKSEKKGKQNHGSGGHGPPH